MTQLVRTGYLLGTSSRRVLFNSASFALDFTTGFYKNAAGYTRTNYILNSTPTLGAVTGVVGSGGALPTRWVNQYNPSGLTTTVVGTGTENGLPYIDIRVSGTWGTAGSNQYNLSFGNSTDVVAANGEAWCAAVPVRVAAGSLTNVATVKIEITQNTAAGAYVSSVLSGDWRSDISAAATPLRINGYGTLAGGASVARAAPQLQLIGSVSSPVDVTLRVGPPQFEKATYPSSYILTHGSAASVTTYTSTNPADVGNMTFTRDSTGYSEDASGNLVLFGSGVPRITNKGVLIEESRTNYVVRSQAFSNAAWSVNISATVSDNSVVAPDGTLTASTITSGGAGNSGVYQFPALGSGVTATFSLYFKSTGSATSVRIGTDLGPAGAWLDFNPTTATITAAGPSLTASGIIPVANGWYRAWGTFVTTAATQSFVVYAKSGAGSTLVVWGAQLEAGSFPTSYIPTTSASVTRPADVFYYTISGIPLLRTSAARSSVPFLVGAPSVIIGVSDGSVNNREQMRVSASGFANVRVVTGNVSQADDSSGPSYTYGSVVTSAQAVTATTVVRYQNGVVSPAGAIPISAPTSLSQLDIGQGPGSSALNGYVQRLAIYPFAASDAQLQSLSSGNFLL